MRIANEELVDPVIFLGSGGLLATSAAFLRPVFRKRLTLDIAGMRKCDDHVGRRDQVFGAEVERAVFNMAAACANFCLSEFQPDGGKFFANDD